MTNSRLTVFAALLSSHRDRLKLTQADVSQRTADLHADGLAPRAVTERTIAALERLTPEEHRVPQHATVRSLAMALELEPGSPDHDAFIAAARDPHASNQPSSSVPDLAFFPAGREPHLRRLESAVASAVHGSPSIVLITGEAGIGKSRILEEVAQRALARHEDAAILWGSCPRGYGMMADHEPWRQILGQMLRDPIAGVGGPLPASNANRLDARLRLAARALVGPAAALVGGMTSIDTLRQPHVLTALDLDLRRDIETTSAPRIDQHTTQPEIHASLLSLLEQYASAGPTVIVLENFQWADDATRLALRNLASELAQRDARIVILGSIRSGDPSTEAVSREVANDVTAHFPDAIVDLDTTIGDEAGRAFVDAAASSVGLEPLAGRLFERTGGMPLYVMTLLRLQEIDATAITGNSVPVEIEGMFARQFGYLDGSARALLAAASVQGDEFYAEPALEAAGVEPSERARYFDESLAGQVIFVGTHDIAPGATLHRYRFADALFHDHVSATLSRLERSHLHLATAESLAHALGSQDHDALELIASQMEQGGELRRAASTWLAAGDRAMQRSDHRHAITLYRHIRQMGVERVATAMHVQAEIGIGNCLRALGRPDRAQTTLSRARREAREARLHTVDANALLSLGVLDFDAGRMVSGAARFAEAIDAYSRAGELVEASRANTNLSFTLHGLGRYDDALSRAEDGIRLGQQGHDVSAVASAEIALANCWLDLGDYERAIASYRAGLVRNEEHGLIHYGNLCMLNIALCNLEMCRWDEAEAMLDRVDEPARRLVDRLRSAASFNRALVMEGRRNNEAARRLYESSREVRHQLRQAPLLIDSLAGLLRIATLTNDHATSATLLDDLERRLDTRGPIGGEHLGRLFLTMFDAHRARGDEARASAWLDAGVAFLRQRAGQLADREHRERFLARPPAHRRIVALAEAAGISVHGSRAGGTDDGGRRQQPNVAG